ncbi:endolytic transglycosylase MltG [Microbacterium sp. HMH0099]|uniref:endolytic transglycosylase MltG n=1 Tax=Microbacterium sp. HMH0099 TaxID=3414026 RepID=UPI003BF6B54B
MPENDPSTDDAFADLFSRLPGNGAAPTPRDADEPPQSRRAAREARRARTGETPQQSADPDAPSSTAPSPETPAPRPAVTDAAAPRPAVSDEANAPRPAASRPAPSERPAASRPAAASAAAGPVRRYDAARRAEPVPAPRAAETADDQAAERRREPVLAGVGAAAAGGGAASAGRPAPSGSLEDLFTGAASTEQIGSTPPRPPRRRRRMGGWIALAISVVLIGALVLVGVNLWNTYGDRVQSFFGASEPLDYEEGMATGEARVTIVSGDTGASVSPKLFDAGVTKTSDALYRYMVENNVVFTFQPGVYRLQQQMTSAAVLKTLQNPDSRLNNTVQLREGLTVEQSLQAVSEQLGLPLEDLQAATADPAAYGVAADTLEGWLFPATYDFDEGVSATDVIARMVDRTVQSLDTAGVPVDDRERILTVASIIEREARFSEDFYKVSRVIENRLDPSNQETFGKLEMDSTVQYGAGEMASGSVSTSEEARNSDNPWNTYMYPGLPKGPIANPGDQAIDAALKPADGPWLYFVTVNLNTGETVFTSTYSEHLKAVDQWRAWCADNPDAGC